jgi:Rne/Rng family ribonuclease
MAKEICISSTPHETRLAILEDDQLAEIYYERENEYTLAGSVYNGRVTRVLPGMQSAFVDIGLERDAFLYVTDFLELEDQEETDELEKAAATGGNQAPREVRHTNGQDRNQDRGQRPGPNTDQRQDRQGRDRRPVVEGGVEAPEGVLAAPSLEISEQADDGQESTGEPGAKRWRGRRRRRGGRGPSESASETQQPAEKETSAPSPLQSEYASEIQASAAPVRAPRAERAPEPFVLPGESLSKYGAASSETATRSEAAPDALKAARPASTFKPASLIESPIEWDGSGLLPGESISRHRGRQSEPEVSTSSVETENYSADGIEEEELVEEMTLPSGISALEPAVAQSLDDSAAVAAEDDVFEETFEAAPGTSGHGAVHGEAIPSKPDDYTLEPVIETPSADEQVAPSVTRDDQVVREHEHDKPGDRESGEKESTESEDDRSASHNVDPLPPAGFRLFGLGGKKKKPEDEPRPAPPAEAKPVTVPTVSAFAPGSGLVEEEVIEGEEYEVTHPHHKADEHDLDEYEEETLQTQIRSGELGEMLQEAHLDHKIQLKFGTKNGEEEDEDVFDGEEEDEEEEPVTAEGQPASDGQTQVRRDRNGRGRRGRGGPGGQGNRRGPSRRTMQTSDLPIISDLLKPGQEILVQIAKEPIAKKGARITSHIALPGRFLVFMPTVSHVGVSRKIASDEERQRLKRVLVHERGEASGGFIVRTAAEGASEEELRADLRFLIHLWDEIKQRSDSSKSPALIYHDLSLIERILRDQVSSNFSSIWVDSEADYERIVRFLNRFSPSLVRRVKLYTKEVPLFEHFGIQEEISKALRSKVWLKSGGSIVINQTEALVAIDINTGKYVGKTARLEDTILKTNLDAIPEIVRQIRLRDLGGIIVIDFIDMDERKNRFKVMAALEEALKNDRAPTKVLQFNDFGLVAITRKRVKQSLERTLSVPCPVCQATGMVKSPTTVCNEIYTELRKMKKHFEGADVLLRVNPETVKVLKANNASWITEFEELTSKNILIKSDASLHPEQFDIQG